MESSSTKLHICQPRYSTTSPSGTLFVFTGQTGGSTNKEFVRGDLIATVCGCPTKKSHSRISHHLVIIVGQYFISQSLFSAPSTTHHPSLWSPWYMYFVIYFCNRMFLILLVQFYFCLADLIEL